MVGLEVSSGEGNKAKTWECKLHHLEVTIFLHFRSCPFNLLQPKASRRKVIYSSL